LHSINDMDEQSPRIFISYKRDLQPDQDLALTLFDDLKSDCSVFIDRSLAVGTNWMESINKALNEADYLIILLSEYSVQSEMVLGEVERAIQVGKTRAGKPAILPVRVRFQQALSYPLNAHLDQLNWVKWDSHKDTPGLLAELRKALHGEAMGSKTLFTGAGETKNGAVPVPCASAQPLQMELPEGTMEAESKFYVVRPSDDIATNTIRMQGVTITIKAPRQMGKSSLLIRSIQEATRQPKRVAFLDFQLIDTDAMASADIFYRQFCSWICEVLAIEDDVAKYWATPLGNTQRTTRFMQRHVLAEAKTPLVLAMDEVDRIFNCSFRSDFFSMLRHWHNSRASNPVWKSLDLVLVTSTEPYQLIEDLHQSPFNVGQVIELSDFNRAQVALLNERHGKPFNPEQEDRLSTLLAGHPYLIRRALYLVAEGRFLASEIFEKATDDRGPFGDHLRYHLFRLHERDDLIESLRQVLKNGSCSDDVFFRLRGAGLVKNEGKAVAPRCPLYGAYFREHLHV